MCLEFGFGHPSTSEDIDIYTVCVYYIYISISLYIFIYILHVYATILVITQCVFRRHAKIKSTTLTYFVLWHYIVLGMHEFTKLKRPSTPSCQSHGEGSLACFIKWAGESQFVNCTTFLGFRPQQITLPSNCVFQIHKGLSCVMTKGRKFCNCIFEEKRPLHRNCS